MGTDTFTLTITYDQPMNIGKNPAITSTGQSPDDAGVSAALRYDDTQSWWLSDHTYKAVYNVVDYSVYIRHVNVAVTGVLDAVGNLQNPSTCLDVFSVNTVTTPVTVVSVVPNLTTITGANVGADTFWVNITYSAATRQNTPTISFSPDISSTLSLDPAMSWWTSGTTYRARYNVADASVTLQNIVIDVSGRGHVRLRPGAVQRPGRLQHRHDLAGPEALPPAALVDAVLSSGALNLSIGARECVHEFNAPLSSRSISPFCTAGRGWMSEEPNPSVAILAPENWTTTLSRIPW